MITLHPRDAFQAIAGEYETALNPVVSLERRVLSSLIPSVQGELVADVGSGTGYWTKRCQAMGARAVAIDLCLEMLRLGPEPAVEADATRLPLRDGSVGVVICSLMLGYAPEAFAELARVVRPGGTLIVSDIHPAALDSGWTRSFRVGVNVVQPKHRRYALEDLRHASLHQTGLVSASFGEEEWAIFQCSAKAEMFDRLRETPAIFAALWRKAC